MTDQTKTLEAADHWDALAGYNEEMAAWERDQGLDLSPPGQSPGDHRAKTYRACAASMRLQVETGVGHCLCHLKPYKDCLKTKARDPLTKLWNAKDNI